ncbi:cyclopropane-fatty-acyl-phospholipid synthase [Streptomyces viridochromogenes]|uniref:Cyclopropane-fatty-acyl-phospholipid synthase n=2 Tax=Streptomyces TaxID=1883 RepID=A0A0L8LDF4_STRVR|nr:cyclopropane-fatty-acyl-phospholipid synthase [Streptomyces viridochromogenes]
MTLMPLPSAVRTGRVPVDPHRWPEVARLPRASAARTAFARLLVERALARLPLRIRNAPSVFLSEGGGVDLADRRAGDGSSAPSLTLHDPDAFHRRIGADGLIGFGESYMAGEWDADDLVGVLTVLARHVDDLVPAPLRRLRGAWVRRRPEADLNTPDGARENIHRHYDLSNELFALFLDPGLSYSSAVFDPLPHSSEVVCDADFTAAQHRKIDRLLDLAETGPGTELLEIGTGWGELAIRAATRGARVRTVTLSEEQLVLARRRVALAGVADRVSVELLDYRHVRGRYDAVVSVEMIEAVGAEFWPDYFTALRRLLAPGGRVALQAITMPHERMLATARTHTWISKYVFPGGLIPSPEALARESAAAGLRITDDTGYGDHYAETLGQWRARFRHAEADVAALGFDPVFQRMWDFYLAYSEAGFRSGYLDVRQLRLTAADRETTP